MEFNISAAKQELKKENDIKSEEILKREERAKKQLGIFKKIYEKTSIQIKIKAIQRRGKTKWKDIKK